MSPLAELGREPSRRDAERRDGERCNAEPRDVEQRDIERRDAEQRGSAVQRGAEPMRAADVDSRSEPKTAAPGSGYDPQHFAAIAAAERSHFWFRARNRVLLTVLAPLGKRLPVGARVLEIGCGTGNTLRVLEQACPTALVVGMDLFAEGLHYARRETRARLLQGRAEAPPFRTRFHLIGLFDVLEHIDRDEDALVAIRNLLEPGGHLVMTVPARRSLWSTTDVSARHARRYERDELIERLANAGYDVRYETPFMTATYPALWLSRRLRPAMRPTTQPQPSRTGQMEREVQAARGMQAVRTVETVEVTHTARPAQLESAQPDVETAYEEAEAHAELRVPAWLNAAFDASLRPERWILRAGGRLPFGSSLLAVATRR